MHPYEILTVLDPAIEGTRRSMPCSAGSSTSSSTGGELENVDKWGKRRLAYEIDGNTEGYYAVITFALNLRLRPKSSA